MTDAESCVWICGIRSKLFKFKANHVDYINPNITSHHSEWGCVQAITSRAFNNWYELYRQVQEVNQDRTALNRTVISSMFISNEIAIGFQRRCYSIRKYLR